MVSAWVDTIEKALTQADPDASARYRENAAAYRQALAELDSWIQAQVSQIPEGKRKLVTDHRTFAYFARRYGFDTVGAVIPSFSTLAEPSAKELAELENTIRDLKVGAIFVDQSANPALSRRVSQDTSVRLVPVYSGSLGEAGGEAATYLDFMRYNTNAIVSALK
jgi:ABC-type Zn uptake system ZnuABC Zn-binding protein ZnuA